MLAQLFLVFPISLNPLPWGALTESSHCAAIACFCLSVLWFWRKDSVFLLFFWELLMEAPDVICRQDAGLRQPL